MGSPWSRRERRALAQCLALLPIAASAWAQTAATANPRHFRYQRAIHVAAGPDIAACAVLPAEVFAHAAPSLSDLRLYRDGEETPYAITVSQAASSSDTAKILNLGQRGGHVVFDLDMPDRAYTSVLLDLDARDFLATAKVEGSNSLTGTSTPLGTFTLFDLRSQGLSRGTAIDLPELRFHYLHFELALSPAPGAHPARFDPAIVQAAEVPPSREAQVRYTPVAEAVPQWDPATHRTVALLGLPAHVPVERASFTIDPAFQGNFSRTVQVSAHAEGTADGLNEEMTGEIARIYLDTGGRSIHTARLSLPATLGVNMQREATVSVAVEDSDGKPLPIAAVRLETRERKLCFDVPEEPVTLFYGDPGLAAPVYDFARFFVPRDSVREARLEPERLNPRYSPRNDSRPYTERHPEFLWLVLLGASGALAVLAFRSTKHLRG